MVVLTNRRWTRCTPTSALPVWASHLAVTSTCWAQAWLHDKRALTSEGHEYGAGLEDAAAGLCTTRSSRRTYASPAGGQRCCQRLPGNVECTYTSFHCRLQLVAGRSYSQRPTTTDDITLSRSTSPFIIILLLVFLLCNPSALAAPSSHPHHRSPQSRIALPPYLPISRFWKPDR
jgi:hypothetical protein